MTLFIRIDGSVQIREKDLEITGLFYFEPYQEVEPHRPEGPPTRSVIKSRKYKYVARTSVAGHKIYEEVG